MDKAGVLKLRSEGKLHPFVEEQIGLLFEIASPGQYTISEHYGITKGRTDTTTYLRGGESIIHIEFFGSESTVERDVINLLQSDADKVIALLIDPQYDPKISEKFRRNNPKKQFTTFWMSDFIDESKKDETIGRLKEITSELEIKKADKEDAVRYKLDTFLSDLWFPEKDEFLQTIAIFPRSDLNVFGKAHFEEQMFMFLEPLGVMDSSDPLRAVSGVRWRKSHKGQYFIVYQNVGKFYTSISVGLDGSFIFVYGDGRQSPERYLTEDSLKNMFADTFKFASKVFEIKKYNGMIDVVGKIRGIEHWDFKKRGQSRHMDFLNLHKFYSNEVLFPYNNFLSEEFVDQEKLDEYFEEINHVLWLNTNQVRISN